MNTTDLQTFLQDKIESELEYIDIPVTPVTLYEPYRYALSIGGKRIRPLLTLLACGLCKGKIEDAMPAALAVEILHNFTLIHDDIMDEAETRRGKPSIYKKWNENVAILSGDVMCVDAFRHLSSYGRRKEFTKAEFTAINEAFLTTVITVCEGQALDMEFVDRNDVTIAEYLHMIEGKTADMISLAFTLGGLSAHIISDIELNYLDNLGHEIGMGFQIQDDLLDVIADPEKFGKRIGGDIFEGKKTYLTLLALERANPIQKEIITKTLSAKNPTQEDVDSVITILKELNVIDSVKDIVDSHYIKANQLLTQYPDSEYKSELENLIIFLKNRDH